MEKHPVNNEEEASNFTNLGVNEIAFIGPPSNQKVLFL